VVYRDRVSLLERARRAEHLRFVGEGQPVPRFDFNSGHAFGQQRLQARRTCVEEFLRRGAAHRAHSGKNAATAAGNLRIGAAAQPLRILAGSRTGEHQMRVAVDEPGREPRAGQVVLLVGIPGGRRREVRLSADPFDAPAPSQQRAALDDSHRLVAGGQSRVAPEF
jgi:hypothetical protein